VIKEAQEVEVKTDAQGNLVLPKELLDQFGSEKRYKTMWLGRQLLVWPASKRFHEVATPEQRARAFQLWVDSHEDGPGLTLEQISRDTIYD